MKIKSFNILRADGGWRPYSFLKISTDEGLVGWSEFVEGTWSPELAEVILSLCNSLVGEDPRRYSRISNKNYAMTKPAAGGLNQQAIAAIENACLDLTAKAYDIPVYSLLGGPIRENIRLYWSHCGSFRVLHSELFEKLLNKKPLENIEDFCELGREAADRGYSAIKTNPIIFDNKGNPKLLNPGFVKQGFKPGREVDASVINAITEQIDAMKEGLGKGRDLMLDCNFGLSPDALIRLTKKLNIYDLAWVEIDLHNPKTLANIRNKCGIPVASLESMHGRNQYLPYLEAGSIDIVIVDVLWNGYMEGLRIANLAEAFELNIAPHNFYGPIGDLISANFCASAVGASIMEIEADDVPWKYELLTKKPTIKDGKFIMPCGPGWGADINEDKIKEYPWKSNN